MILSARFVTSVVVTPWWYAPNMKRMLVAMAAAKTRMRVLKTAMIATAKDDPFPDYVAGIKREGQEKEKRKSGIVDALRLAAHAARDIDTTVTKGVWVNMNVGSV